MYCSFSFFNFIVSPSIFRSLLQLVLFWGRVLGDEMRDVTGGTDFMRIVNPPEHFGFNAN